MGVKPNNDVNPPRGTTQKPKTNMSHEEQTPYVAQGAETACTSPTGACRIKISLFEGILGLPDSDLRPTLEALITGNTEKCHPGVAWAVRILRGCAKGKRTDTLQKPANDIQITRRSRLPAK